MNKLPEIGLWIVCAGMTLMMGGVIWQAATLFPELLAVSPVAAMVFLGAFVATIGGVIVIAGCPGTSNLYSQAEPYPGPRNEKPS